MKTYTVEVYDDGDRFWHNSNGRLHREDGPAIEYADGRRSWYLNDKLHREDGPAIEKADGSRSWYLNDEYLTEQEFNDRQTVTEMKLSEVEALLGKKIKIISE